MAGALAEGGFQFFALRDVVQGTHQEQFPLLIAKPGPAGPEDPNPPGVVGEVIFTQGLLAGAEDGFVQGPQGVRDRFGEEVAGALAEDLMAFPVQDGAIGLVRFHPAVLPVQHEDGVADGVDDLIQELLGIKPLEFGQFAGGDIFQQGDKMSDVPRRIPDGGDRGGFPEQLAVFLPVVEFAVPLAARRDGGP